VTPKAIGAAGSGAVLTSDSIAIITVNMPQLLVRAIEPAIVQKLRSFAAAQGVSVEEAHRRVLRSALLGGHPDPKRNFIEYLRSIPQGDEAEFARSADLPRSVAL